MNKYLRLLRVSQWYKNLVVYLALFFTSNVLNLPLLFKTTLGFLVLCMTSSSYHILNDIRDVEEDRKHPEKKTRPIASREVSKNSALSVSIILLAAALVVSYVIEPVFFVFVLLLFSASIAYNIRLKEIAFLDIHMIALNFLIKAVSGAFLINVAVSPWLITTVFFMALLLGIGKRRADLHLLGKDALAHKKVYSVYTEALLDKMLLIVATSLLFTYSLYTFMVHQNQTIPYMMFTIPFGSFMIFRYLYLVEEDPIAARKTQYIFKDKHMTIMFLLWVLTSFVVMTWLK